MQSHSAVYCGNQQPSYHGSTVQVVQCNSLLEVYHDDRISTSIIPSSTLTELSTDQFAGTSKCNLEQHHHATHLTTLPKRPRTIAVESLTSSFIKDTAMQPNSHTLTMSDFEESKKELDEWLLLDHKLFTYVTLKLVAYRCQKSTVF